MEVTKIILLLFYVYVLASCQNEKWLSHDLGVSEILALPIKDNSFFAVNISEEDYNPFSALVR